MKKFQYEIRSEWPPLAWAAKLTSDSETIDVLVGPKVECRPDWFAEAVWDQPFAEGDFDRTDQIFGSGGRIRDAHCDFVSSASVVDRLQFLKTKNATWVSNSLPALLAVTGQSVQTHRSKYACEFTTITRGIDRYLREIPTLEKPVRLVYFRNLRWTPDRLTEIDKPLPVHDFSSFERYHDFMVTSLVALFENARDEERQGQFEPLSTISTGYDSPAVSALMAAAGGKETLSIRNARGGDADSGEQISLALGLQPYVVDRDAWRKRTLPEVSFLASDAKGEDVYFAGAHDQLCGRLLLTGYGGQHAWGKTDKEAYDFRRGDQSGLSHTENRLWAGYLHCPVPFLGGRQAADLRSISCSPAMAAWEVEGSYSFPIPRRIVEQQGVDRTWFGMSKKAASVLLFDRFGFLTENSLVDYEAWYKENFRGMRQFSDTLRNFSIRMGAETLHQGLVFCQKTSPFVPGSSLRRLGHSSRLNERARREPHFEHLFPWAMEEAIRHYNG